MSQGNNSGGAGAWAGGIPGVPTVAGRFQPYLLEPGSPNAYTCFGSWEVGARSCIPIEEADDPLDGCSQSGECKRFTLEQNPPTTRFPVSPRRDGRFEIQQFRDFIREVDTYNMTIETGRIVVTYPGNRSVPKAKRFFLNVKNLEEAELDVNQEFELIVTVERMILRQAGALSPTGAPRGGRPLEEDPEARRLRIAARLRKAAGEAARSSDGLGDELELELDIDFDDDVDIDDELDDEEEIEIDLSSDDTAGASDDTDDASDGEGDDGGLDDFDDGDLDGLEGLEGDDDEDGGDHDDEAPAAAATGDETPPAGKTKKKGDGKGAKGGKSAKARDSLAPAKKGKAAIEPEPAPKKKSSEAAPKTSLAVEAAPAKKKVAEKEAPAKKTAPDKKVAAEAPKKKVAEAAPKKAASPAAASPAAAPKKAASPAAAPKAAAPKAAAPKAKAAEGKKAAATPVKAEKKKS